MRARLLPLFALTISVLLYPHSMPAQSPAPASPATTSAQTIPAAISGTVSDQSGAKIAGAAVHAESNSVQRDAVTDNTGRFALDLPPGTYRFDILSPGFETYARPNVLIGGKPLRPLLVTLRVAGENEVLTVDANPAASTGAGDNQSALVFKKEQLDTLSDDDATLQQQLLAIAGGDGQHPPQIYVDGFTGGRFPPKSSIREVRINQNPYSAQYDGLGFGRIEIFTKPGSDKLHGFLQTQGNSSAFNARNPFTGVQPPYHQIYFDGNLSGPLGKKTSFFLGSSYNDQQNNAVVNAVILDPTNNQAPFSSAVPNPVTNNTQSLRLDRQLTTNNTFTARYEYNQTTATNSGVGLLVLPSEGLNNNTTTQTLQVGNTQIVNPHVISETRFQYIRTRLQQSAVSNAPTVIVQGSFSGGGSPAQAVRDNQDRYEFQEYLSVEHGKHFIRAGARYRLLRNSNLSTGNYNGQYTFPTIAAYQITQEGLAAGLNPTQIRASGGGATQFSLTAGRPSAAILTGDIGLYAEDEWKATKTLTLNYGLRFETQSAIPDHSDPAPRFGFAWAVHQHEKRPAWFTLRGGSGLFYNRFDSGSLLTSVRQNGITQQSYFVTNPDTYPNLPVPTSLTGTAPTVYRVDPNLRSSYDIASGLTVERSLGKIGSITVNYLNFRSVHQYLSLNINAPLPGTYNPADPTSGTRPLGGTGNLYQFSSQGVSRGNIIFSNYNLHPAKWVSIWGFYVNQHFNSDATDGPNGAGAFASNSYNVAQDYGRSTFNITHRLFTGASLNLPRGITLEPFLIATSGSVFNITTGSDNNGDTIYNDRPAFATDLTRASVVRTAYGNFDTSPLPTQRIIPINYGRGPAFASLQISASKGFHFGRCPLPLNLRPPNPPTARPPTPTKNLPRTTANPPRMPKPSPCRSLRLPMSLASPLNPAMSSTTSTPHLPLASSPRPSSATPSPSRTTSPIPLPPTEPSPCAPTFASDATIVLAIVRLALRARSEGENSVRVFVSVLPISRRGCGT